MTFKRRIAQDHLIDETAQTPPIDVNTMACLTDHLRGQILRSATNRKSTLLFGKDLAQSEICKLYVSDVVKDDVFGFKAALGRSYSR